MTVLWPLSASLTSSSLNYCQIWIALSAFLYIKYRQSMEIGQYFYVVRGVPQQMPPDEVEAIIDQLPEESRS